MEELQRKNLESIGVCDGMGGQGQYRLGRGSIGWAGAVSAVPLPKSDFQHIKKSEKYWGPRSFGGGQEQ